MAVDGGIRHDVSSDEGGLFLLTLVGPGPSHASEASLGSGQTRSCSAECATSERWRIHAEARLFDRLATTPVRIE